MKDNSGDQPRLRQGIVAGLTSIALATLAGGCQGGNKPRTDETPAATITPVAEPSQPLPITTVLPLGRGELLAVVAAAADAVAAGGPLPTANLEFTNRTFELRLPFGCAGNSGDWWEWSIDPKARVLRINVRPQTWADDLTMKALAGDIAFDGAEGFWIERPWTRSENCPSPVKLEPVAAPSPGAALPTASPDQPPPRTVALVQYFSPDAPRTLRRGSRPYSYTGKLPETGQMPSKTFRLKLAGRISGFGDGQPVHCATTTPYRPPVCAAAVEFSQVILEDAVTGESLAEWHS